MSDDEWDKVEGCQRREARIFGFLFEPIEMAALV